MTRARGPNLTEQIAALLLTLRRVDDNGQLVPVIGYEASKQMTPKQIIAAFERDHYPVRMTDRVALSAVGIPYINHPANITFRPKLEHRRKSAEKDAPEIAKTRRITGETKGRPKKKWPKRPFPRGRGFQQQVVQLARHQITEDEFENASCAELAAKYPAPAPKTEKAS